MEATAMFNYLLAQSLLSLRGAKRRSNPFFLFAARWIASRSLSSGAHSRDPLARNDGGDSHVPDFVRHVIKCRMAVNLGFCRLEHHALLGRIGCGDRAR